jgi:hypothetical protein
MTKPVIYDAGMLIALEKSDRRAVIHHEQVSEIGEPLVPASVLAQVLRDPARQAKLNRVVRMCEVVPLTEQDAREIGPLLNSADSTDVVDAHVVMLGLSLDAVVYSSDPDDLRELLTAGNATLPIITI